MTTRARRLSLTLVACGLALTAAYLLVYSLGNLRLRLVEFEGAFFFAFLVYLAAAWSVLRRPIEENSSRQVLGLILGFALLFRLTMLAASPTLSDDLYRYVWEGKILANGYSPYQYPPDSPQLAWLRDELWAGINNKGVPSPYPPLAQLVGLVGHWLMPNDLLAPKLSAALADVGIILALLALLRASGMPAAAVVVYAWNPLPVMEFAHSGHNDGAMVLLLVVAAVLLLRRRPWLSATALAGATLAKAAPLVAVPFFALRWGWRPALLYLALVVAGYGPLLLLGGGAFGSLGEYTLSWADNDSVHLVLRGAFALLSPSPEAWASVASAGIGLVALVSALFHPRLRGRSIAWQCYFALTLSLLLGSNVHAWYLIWLLPFLCLLLRPAKTPLVFVPTPAFGWLLFSALVVLPYLTYRDHRWEGWEWVPVAEYLPLFVFLTVPVLRWSVVRLPALWKRRSDTLGSGPADASR